MKNKLILFIVLLGFVGLFSSCEDDKDLPILGDSSTFVAAQLTNAATGSGALGFDIEGQEFENFSWSSADYGQQLAVGYTFEVATSDTFADANTFVQTEETSASVTVKQVNDVALLLGLEPFEEGTLHFRVISAINGVENTEVVSSTITRTVTPYVTDFSPIYMIGAALKGWDTSLAVEVYGTGPAEYSVIAEFQSGETFRFFEAADWGATSYNWSYFDGGVVDANFENGMDGDTNLRFIGDTGFYRISVDLSDKTITMESLLGQPTLFMVGAAVPAAGWGWDSPIDMTWVQDGVFEATTELLNDPGASFRFFTAFDDWGSGLNFPYYTGEGYEIDDKFEDAMDGDNNFRFNGTTGTFKITVNEIDQTIVVSEAGTAGPPKYLVGAGVPAAGWGWATPVELVQIEVGVFEATTDFANDAFRVFDAFDDWGSGTNYPGFADDGYTIDANFENAMDGDSNFSFTGTPGTYKFTLDTNSKTITLE